MKHTIITKKEFISGQLPPILTTKEYKSLQKKYNEQDKKEGEYCYKPYRNLRNYLQ